ncbi:PhoH-like protein [Caedimonas varicaedens]|uniref:PhoH-like protein n=1 Tax=Caedimonas varicaedens TaxID=1629334 RepID=A0A0K8ME39_9PROT|nr:PhoH-like protein [Caedimonas varicaedens]
MKNGTETVLTFDFEDNRLLPLLFGERDQYLAKIEDTLNVIISARGNHLVVTGDAHQAEVAQAVLKKLYDRLKKGLVVSTADVDAALRLQKGKADTSFDPDLEVVIPARGRVISPRTPGQSRYIQLMQNNDLVFGIGPAGTGKTYLAVATAVASLLSGQVNRIILSRPAVEAGERLGFLPGDLREKVDPYLRPLFDALYDMLPSEQVSKRISSGEIEIAPLAFMRGRTLTRSFIILDEAQNSSIAQMKMFLTRLGNGSKMVVTGDLTQVDLPPGTLSGLPHALNILSLVPDIGFGYFDDQDIVRHALVTRIVQAYEKQQQK